MDALYLDVAATSAVRKEVLEAAWPYLTRRFGNPSSSHTLGDAAASALADARAGVALAFGARASEVVFTSGGSEGDNLAVKGLALAAPRGRHVVTTRIEHEAVLGSADYLARLHGFEVEYADVDETGTVTPDALTRVLRPDTTLVSIAYANNEVGTVQPIAELARMARQAGARFHTDAVQAAPALDLTARALGVDAITIAGHKLGTPRGIGALYVRAGVRLEPLVHGGGQERGRRSGTENVAGAVALAAALRLAAADPHDPGQRDTFIGAVLRSVPNARLTGHPRRRLPGHASFVFPGTSGESVLLELERRGVLCSSGSACAAGRDEPSHVLTAIGLPVAVAQTAVRFSWGPEVGAAELAVAADAVRDAVASVATLHT